MSITLARAQAVPEGDGVIVKRLMPTDERRNFDPFVLWDHFDLEAGGFPDHPHRGFEAITYLFAGGMRHTDNLGNKGSVYAGGAQRFTAGRGITHSEFPDVHAAGIQLWINLPKRLKGITPDYQQLQAEIIPEQKDGEVLIRTIVGEDGGITLHTEVEYLDIQMPAGSEIWRLIAAGRRGLVYSVEGEAEINLHTVGPGEALFIENETMLHIVSSHGARLMWCFGRPHGEPIYQHGPFVD